MFDPEKLLGGLLRSGFGSRRTGRLLKGGAAMALLGVALEAAEHYMKTTSPPSRDWGVDGRQRRRLWRPGRRRQIPALPCPRHRPMRALIRWQTSAHQPGAKATTRPCC